MKANLVQKKEVVIVAMTELLMLDFAGPSDVFNYANQCLEALGPGEGYKVTIVAPTADKTIVTGTGVEIRCQLSAMEINRPVDTLMIAGNDEKRFTEFEPFYRWLGTIGSHNCRRITSVCGGALVLAQAGLLNGKKATTHWDLTEQFKRTYPEVLVNTNPFFINDGEIYTSAGVSSGIDLALALVEEDYGKEIAVKVARQLVFYLSRPGFQSQFSSLLPVYEGANIANQLKEWSANHLHEQLDVCTIADHFNMTPRNLTRVFQKQAGMPPAKFVEKLRVEAARKALEDSDMPLERIAERCGLGGLVSMRRIFLRHLMTTPSDYRRAFRTSLKSIDSDNEVEVI